MLVPTVRAAALLLSIRVPRLIPPRDLCALVPAPVARIRVANFRASRFGLPARSARPCAARWRRICVRRRARPSSCRLHPGSYPALPTVRFANVAFHSVPLATANIPTANGMEISSI